MDMAPYIYIQRCFLYHVTKSLLFSFLYFFFFFYFEFGQVTPLKYSLLIMYHFLLLPISRLGIELTKIMGLQYSNQETSVTIGVCEMKMNDLLSSVPPCGHDSVLGMS